eukprot:TRINITY_DN67402_c0_g1_i1.p1 TRINITY_DN67402_c0_g1~~TRINITY_DN67402_c0_g1_i1.p1  ORF type:complete len:856 (-),score=137.94 TRINITY_DN67402_c0_g1_i1:13-2580(-)
MYYDTHTFGPIDTSMAASQVNGYHSGAPVALHHVSGDVRTATLEPFRTTDFPAHILQLARQICTDGPHAAFSQPKDTNPPYSTNPGTLYADLFPAPRWDEFNSFDKKQSPLRASCVSTTAEVQSAVRAASIVQEALGGGPNEYAYYPQETGEDETAMALYSGPEYGSYAPVQTRRPSSPSSTILDPENQNLTFRPEITRMARQLTRAMKTPDALFQKADEYRQHIEDMRRQKELDELKELHFYPQTNNSRPFKAIDGVKTSERLHAQAKLLQAKREAISVPVQEVEPPHSPNINRQSRNLQRSPLQWQKWAEMRDNRRQALARRALEEELGAVPFTPNINENSDQIAKRHPRFSIRIEDRLLLEGLDLRSRQDEDRMREDMRIALEAMSTRASPTPGNSHVHERLFNEAKIKLERKRLEEMRMDQLFARKTDPDTGERLYSPRISRKTSELAERVVEAAPVHERLLALGEMSAKKREEMLTQLERNSAAQRDVSQYLGPYTNLLNEIVEKRTNTPTKNRVLTPTKQYKARTVSSELTFSPSINPYSREIDKSRDAITDISSVAAALDMTNLSSTSTPGPLRSRSTSPTSRRGSDALPARAMEWKSRIEKRRERERQDQERRSLEHCTFQPKVTTVQRSRSQRPRSPSKPSKASTTSVEPRKSRRQSLPATPNKQQDKGVNLSAEMNAEIVQRRPTSKKQPTSGRTAVARNDSSGHNQAPPKAASVDASPPSQVDPAPGGFQLQLHPPPVTIPPSSLGDQKATDKFEQEKAFLLQQIEQTRSQLEQERESLRQMGLRTADGAQELSDGEKEQETTEYESKIRGQQRTRSWRETDTMLKELEEMDLRRLQTLPMRQQ